MYTPIYIYIYKLFYVHVYLFKHMIPTNSLQPTRDCPSNPMQPMQRCRAPRRRNGGLERLGLLHLRAEDGRQNVLSMSAVVCRWVKQYPSIEILY